ncbi:uncharacterized protein TNCT_349491 [Trichonephila clavata]|uniref:Uncharacterized protein n=1 Tax=Trichonephila clavata TaxID=2740835 RepID=A0A8X6FAF9_TRICU|nr:uncharacterized protein TNCT_349491 [Trichonephila clavata]
MSKPEWSVFTINTLQTFAYISLNRNRKNIRLLIRKLSKLSTLLPSALECYKLNILIWPYTTFMCSLILGLTIMVIYLNYGMQKMNTIRTSDRIPEGLRKYFATMFYISLTMAIVILHGLCFAFAGYYHFVCNCMKLFFLEFISKTKDLIKLQDYQSALQIYQELTETMSFVNDFLAFPAFLNVLSIMFGLFIYSYVFVIFQKDDYLMYVFTLGGVTYYLMALIPMIMSGADCNWAASQARDKTISLPGWFPQHYRMLKMFIRQKFKKKYALTLWKIYVIRESLLMSALGTLVTYGFLVGTMGIAQGLEAENH